MRIKVTGSSGYVGSLLCKMLSIPQENRYDIISEMGQWVYSKFEPRDVLKASVTESIVQSCDVIVHLAAISGIKQCSDDPITSALVNTDSTIQLAQEAKKAGVRRFIFASSSAVYGEAQSFKMDESHPTEPRSLYGKQKLEAESILKLADKKFEVVILRKSNLYGQGIVSKGITVIDKFMDSLINDRPISITGDGSQKRDFIHVFDASSLYARIAQAPRVRSGIYNIGGYEPLSIRAIAELVNDYGERILSRRVPIEFKPSDGSPLFHDFRYDWSKARCEFNFSPMLTIEYAIKEKLLGVLRGI